MVETTELPRAIRTCLNCGAGMVAQRASRGEGWAVPDTVNSENLANMASGFLVLVGNVAAFYLPLLYGTVLDTSSLWISRNTACMYRPKRGQQAIFQIVEVKDDLFVKNADKICSSWMQQYGFRAIYCILLIAAIVILIDWFGT